jgi:hypothetical protein
MRIPHSTVGRRDGRAMEVGDQCEAYFHLVGPNGHARLNKLVAVPASLVRGRRHHPSSGNAKSYARAIAAGWQQTIRYRVKTRTRFELKLYRGNIMSHQIHSYSELQQQIHEDLRRQHPEWVRPNGDCPTCDSYEQRLAELISRFESAEGDMVAA